MYRTIRIAAVAVAATLAAAQLAYASSDICARMQARLDQLSNNINLDDYELRLRRDRVVAALDANNCPVIDSPIIDEPRHDAPLRDDPRYDYPVREEPRRAPHERPYEVFGPEPEAIEPEMSTAPAYGGRYQTLCVRSCDGYYFPISYDTGAENFARDEAQCQSQCPGAKLFYRPTDNQDTGAMISLRGDLYKNMPNAFRFRKVGANVTPQCTCQRTAGDFKVLGDPKQPAKSSPKQSETATGTAAPAPAETAKAAPKAAEPAQIAAPPAAEPAKAEEPKTAKTEPSEPATTASSIIELGEPETKTAEVEKPQPLSEDRPIDPNRKVRVVGPTFLPDQEGAINLRAPDQKSAQ